MARILMSPLGLIFGFINNYCLILTLRNRFLLHEKVEPDIVYLFFEIFKLKESQPVSNG